jgi:galactitol-specific phosphotransferase system IIC component
VDTYYGIFSGIYTAAGAVGVAYGYPGNLIMPVSFGIIGLGGLHAFIIERKRGKMLKAVLFLALGAGIYLAGVFL